MMRVGEDGNGTTVTQLAELPQTASPADIPPPAQNNPPKNLEFLKKYPYICIDKKTSMNTNNPSTPVLRPPNRPNSFCLVNFTPPPVKIS